MTTEARSIADHAILNELAALRGAFVMGAVFATGFVVVGVFPPPPVGALPPLPVGALPPLPVGAFPPEGAAPANEITLGEIYTDHDDRCLKHAPGCVGGAIGAGRAGIVTQVSLAYQLLSLSSH